MRAIILGRCIGQAGQEIANISRLSLEEVNQLKTEQNI